MTHKAVNMRDEIREAARADFAAGVRAEREKITPRRYIVSTWERAKVQYEVLADSEDEARAMYERGDVGRMLVDEHEDGEIADITDVTGRGLHG